MVKILEVQIKVQDDKGHIKILTKDDIELDSIVIKTKQVPKPTLLPVEEAPPVERSPPVEEKPVEPEKPKKTRHKKSKKV